MRAFLVLVAAAVSLGAEIRLEDVTAKSGIAFRNVCGVDPGDKVYITETMGAGAAWLDYDGDGCLDLYLVNGSTHGRGPGRGEPNRLFRGNCKGRFEDVTSAAGVGDRGWGYGVAVGDIDNDGDPDLYVTNLGRNVLLRNEGDGTFRDVTKTARVGDPSWSTSAAFFDIEPDGDLDLYVANYVAFDPARIPARGSEKAKGNPSCTNQGIEVVCGPLGLPPAQDVLYRNDGDGTFTDVTRELGVHLAEARYALGVVTGDYDNDGRQDVYVANDSVENSLWRNLGEKLEDVGVVALAAFHAEGGAQAGMGTDFGDYDNDGWLDLIVTNFSMDLNTVYRNLEGVLFSDVSFAVGMRPTFMALSWGTGFHDLDRDGDLDLFIANGHVYAQVDDHGLGTRYRQTNDVFENVGGRFEKQPARLGLARAASFRGAAFGDYDNDGDIDVAVTALDEAPQLLRNDTRATGHHLQVRLVGQASNRDGVGTRVTARIGDVVRVRERKGGGSYLSAGDPRLHFGLGNSAKVDRLEVRWPSGRRQVLRDVPADRVLTIEEPAESPQDSPANADDAG